MVNSDIKEKLQHPRRSLGNRHRSQAEKFLKISNDESNLNWADQSAKQAILYDFTNIIQNMGQRRQLWFRESTDNDKIVLTLLCESDNNDLPAWQQRSELIFAIHD